MQLKHKSFITFKIEKINEYYMLLKVKENSLVVCVLYCRYMVSLVVFFLYSRYMVGLVVCILYCKYIVSLVVCVFYCRYMISFTSLKVAFCDIYFMTFIL